MKKKHNQSGRSIIETLAVLALVALLAIGGLKGWTMLKNAIIARDIETAVSEYVAQRHHELMGSTKKASNKISEKIAHNKSILVENGVEGTSLSGVFWIELGSATDLITKEVCEKILASQNIQPYRVEINGVLSSDCVEDGQIVRMYFKNNPSGEDPQITYEDPVCGTRVCPNGAICSNGHFSCIAGYQPVTHEDPCKNTCTSCTGNTVSASQNASCEECPAGQHPNEQHTACISCPQG